MEHRRIDQRDQIAVDRAVADGYRFIGTIHSYEMPTGSAFEIRLAKSDDLCACKAIAVTELRHSRLYADETIPFEFAQEVYRQRIARAFDETTVFVAEISVDDGSRIAGFCTLADNTIDLIAVNGEYQGLGIGTALVGRCRAKCRKDGHNTLHVATQGSNRQARSFYERCGFERTKILQDFHKDG